LAKTIDCVNASCEYGWIRFSGFK